MLTVRLGLPAASAHCSRNCRSGGTARGCPAVRVARRSRCRCGSPTSRATPMRSASSAAPSARPGGARAGRRRVRSGDRHMPRRRRRRDPRARAGRLGMGARPRGRARPAPTLEGDGDRRRAGGDGRLRGPRVAVPDRALGRRGASSRPPRRRARPRRRRPERCAERARARRRPRRGPVRIWQKPGPLTPEECGARQAPRLSLRADPEPLAVPRRARAEVASAHHERLDGSGYHRGAPRRR